MRKNECLVLTIDQREKRKNASLKARQLNQNGLLFQTTTFQSLVRVYRSCIKHALRNFIEGSFRSQLQLTVIYIYDSGKYPVNVFLCWKLIFEGVKGQILKF